MLCTNPASLADPTATAGLNPYFWIADRPSRQVLSTDWVVFPQLYTAECHQADGASWLQVNDIGTAGDTRTRLSLTERPGVGLPRLRRERGAGRSRHRRPGRDHRLRRPRRWAMTAAGDGRAAAVDACAAAGRPCACTPPAVTEALAAAGYDDIPRNGSYVISASARRSTPLSAIIERLGLSKQASGQLVDNLVARGYLDARRRPRGSAPPRRDV